MKDESIKMNNVIYEFAISNKLVILTWILLTFLLYPLHHVIIPKYYGLVINSFKDSSNTFKDYVKYLSAFYVISMVIESSLYYCTKLISPEFAEFATSRLYNYIIDNYEMDFDNIHSGEVLSKIADLSTLFFDYLETARMLVFSQIFVFATTLYYYWQVSNELFMFFLLSVIVNTFYIYFVFKKKFDVDVKIRSTRSKLFEYMNDSMINLVSIYTTNNEEQEKNRFIEKEYRVYKNYEIDAMNIYFIGESTWNVVCVIIFFVLNYLLYNAYLEKKINTETLVSTFTLTFSVLRFFEKSAVISSKISSLYSEIHDIEHFLNNIRNVNKSSKTDKKIFINGDIEYKNVYHKYNDKFVLDNVSLKIKKGEKVVLVGTIGSGKSTAVKLLLGFQPLKMGTITINNININEISNTEMRNNVYYIPQKPKLFNRTLYENIVYGLKHPPNEETIINLLNKLNMDEISIIFKEKMNTQVGLDGNTLSGGQKQIVWLLRAFYSNCKILIMDEPTASLDQSNKELLIKNIKTLASGKTLIVISHDKIDNDFRKITFNNGRIIENMTDWF